MPRPRTRAARLWRFLNQELGRPERVASPRRQRGVALIFVLVSVTLLGALTVDHTYKSQIDLASSNNARDEVKAEFLARSAINLARIMLKVQERVIDRNRQAIGQFLGKDLQVSDILPFLLEIFFGNSDLLQSFGMDRQDVRGLDIPRNYGLPRIDAVDSEDGKLNVNCAFVRSETDTQVQLLAGELLTLFMNPRYEELFQRLDEIDDPDRPRALARAIIDYVDPDTAFFGGGGGAENYKYSALEDGYEEKNHLMDSVEELHLVQGINDEVWSHLGPSFTVYGSCMPNLCAVQPGNWMVAAAVIVKAAKDDKNPVLYDPILLAQVSQAALMTLQLSGCTDLGLFAQGAANPSALMTAMSNPAALLGGGGVGAGANLPGVELDNQKLQGAAYIGARRFYRISVTGMAGYGGRDKLNNPIWRVHKSITAVWDQQGFSTATGQRGMFVHWKQD
ncbi:MAG: type II secretion system protein GspK [Polyangia bacterium]|nr:type II secretion system protein GspK [Polyangia bacterium]